MKRERKRERKRKRERNRERKIERNWESNWKRIREEGRKEGRKARDEEEEEEEKKKEEAGKYGCNAFLSPTMFSLVFSECTLRDAQRASAWILATLSCTQFPLALLRTHLDVRSSATVGEV